MNEAEKIWQEVIETAKEKMRPPEDCEMTVAQFSEATGMNETNSRDLLERYVKQGLFTKRKFNNKVCLYRPVV